MMRHLLLVTLVGLALGPATGARATPPAYILLRPPATVDHSKGYRGVYAAPMRPVARQPYAYGWFGVRPRGHWHDHWGYRNSYHEWIFD